MERTNGRDESILKGQEAQTRQLVFDSSPLTGRNPFEVRAHGGVEAARRVQQWALGVGLAFVEVRFPSSVG